jgi:hypothetical protein
MENFKGSADKLMKYTFKGNWIYAIIILSLYTAEIVMMILKYIDNYNSFANRPTYDEHHVLKHPDEPNNTEWYSTVSKKGTDKDCGDYYGAAYQIKDFVNDFPGWVSIFYFAYMASAIIIAVADVVKRILKIVNKSKVKHSTIDEDDSLMRQENQNEPELSPVWISLVLIIFFYIPVFKVTSSGITYPLVSAKYGECIHIGARFMITEWFYVIMWMGFTLTNGYLWILMYLVLPSNTSSTKLIKFFVLIFNVFAIIGAVFLYFLFVCLPCLIKCFRSNVLARLFFYLYWACLINLVIFTVFTMFVIPFISEDKLKSGVMTLSVFIRFLLARFCEHL